MNDDTKIRDSLARIMVWGVLLAAAVMLAGGIAYLAANPGARPGDHVFAGEPLDLRDPVAIARDALTGGRAAIIQIGVLLLLMNPVVRVAFAAVGFAATGDRLYAVISAVVLAVLGASFFL